MAETKADDDDDEGFFGDFTSSSSFPTNPTLQINNHTSTTDDDDWGDFVEYPLQTSGHSHTQAHPNKPVPNQTDQSVSNGVELEKKKKNTQWVKPSGALPLSLFGDDDDDDDAVDEKKSSVADPSARDNMRNETNVHLGVGNNDIFTNLYHQQPQIKAANGFNPQLYESNFNSSSNLSLRTENELNSDSNKLMSTSASNLGGLPSSFGLGRSLNSDSNVLVLALAENGLFSNSNQLLSMSSSNLGGLSLDFNELQSSSNGAVVGEEEFDGEDEGWEFKDAFTESNKIMNGNDKLQEFSEVPMFPSGLSNGSHVELFSVTNGSESHKTEVLSDFEPSIRDQRGVMVQNGLISHAYSLRDSENGLKSDSLARSIDSDANFQEFGAAFSKAGSNEKVQEFSEIAMFPTGLQNGSNGPIDLFSVSNGFSSKTHEVVDGFDFKPITLDKDGFVSDSYQDSDRMDGETRLTSDPIVGSADSDENFGEFETAFPEAESNQKGNETRAEKQRGAVPLSIFGIDEPEVDESKDILHNFTYKPATFRRNTQSHNFPLSINDLLADLYNQAEPITSPGSKARTNEVGLDSADSELNSNIVNGDDDFDDGSWEFKDALSESRAQAQNSHFCDDDDKKNLSPNTELNDFVDFYLKLKDDLCFVARNHLNSLKAQSAASLSGQDAKVAALDEDIKEACDKLHQENIISKEIHSEDQPSSYVRLKKYLEALHGPKFNGLESEYNLSTRLSLAESDLRSTIELIKHSTTMLKILRLVSVKELSDYLCTWSKMISVCAQELKHGAWIWNQASEKNLQTRILFEPRGQRYILALGEIYRAAVVLEASAKLYKPWILSGSVDLMGLYALLEECHTLWFTSGLEEALMRMKDMGLAYKDTVKSLLEYIKQIRDLDANGMTDKVSAQQESLCRLSILTPVVVPGMKLVVWNGENYFLVLANLWANLISSDPPKLPCLHVG